jgi:hypothetical protein
MKGPNNIFSEINIDNIIKKNGLAEITKQNKISILEDIPTSSELYAKKSSIKIPSSVLGENKIKLNTPQVIDTKIKKKLDKAVKIHDTILEKEQKKGFWQTLVTFYNNWILPNIILILFVIFLCVILYYRCDSISGYSIRGDLSTEGYNKSAQVIRQNDLRKKVSNITLQSLQIKSCGHQKNQPCLCHKIQNNIHNTQNLSNLSTKENILKSINTMPYTPPPIITPPITNTSVQNTADQSTFNSTDFNMYASESLFDDSNTYLNSYQIEPPFSA